MALVIDKQCISCDACRPACPNDAISEGDLIYFINQTECSECAGNFDQPICIDVCPVDSIHKDNKWQK